MDDYIEIKRDERQIAREREKARQLRKSAWWQAQLDKGICHYCGEKFTREDLTMDHIVPVVRGGKSNKANVVVCCKDCNNAKKYLTPVELILREYETQNPTGADLTED
ncbi:MAG: HNH endonuclease signature motif containing protein [Victivallaceae bacterium]